MKRVETIKKTLRLLLTLFFVTLLSGYPPVGVAPSSADESPIPPESVPGGVEIRIESKTVPFEAKGVTLGIAIGNGVDISSFTMPLQVRSLSGGAFWKNVQSQLDTLPWTGRLAGVFTQNRVFDTTEIDGTSPDAFVLSASQGSGSCMLSGELEEMITLRFDVTEDSGSFVIDTALSSPSGNVRLTSCSKGRTILPRFMPGVVHVVGAPDESYEYKSWGAVGFDFPGNSTMEDYDGDEILDIAWITWVPVLPPTIWVPVVLVRFGEGDGEFALPDSVGMAAGQLHPAYVDGDGFPDILMARYGKSNPVGTQVWLSNGDRTFSEPVVSTVAGIRGHGSAVGFINEDAFLDVLVGNTLLYGDGNGNFAFGDTPFGGFIPEVIELFDLDDDGHQDVIGISYYGDFRIYYGNGYGVFRLAYRDELPHTVIVEGSHEGGTLDFDGDRKADFAFVIRDDISYYHRDTTSVVHVLFGDGRARIDERFEFAVNGACEKVEALDFNNDGYLDIAVGCNDRIRILLGDGSRGFQQLHSIPLPGLERLRGIGDFRRDGAWDFLTSNGVLLNTAQVAAPLLDSQMVSAGVNHVLIRVTNPVDQTVEELGNFIPGARLAARDIDSNGVVDQQISDLNLQIGEYTIDVWRDPSAPSGSNYTLAIGINGHKARTLARNAATPEPGDTIRFNFPVGQGLEVSPPTGGYAATTRPTLDWSEVAAGKRATTQYSFEIDDQMDFESPEYSVSALAEPRVTLPSPLQPDSLYYWRYRAFDGTSWSDYSPAYAVNTPGCDCPFQSDFDASGSVDPADLSALISVIFGGAPDSQADLCPTTRADFDGDGFVDTSDLTKLIDYLFAGGSGTADPCLAHP